MTVGTTTPETRYSYTGLGNYNFSFPVAENDDLYVDVLSDTGESSTITEDVHYTVNFTSGSSGSGYIELTTEPTLAHDRDYLKVRRVTPTDQPDDLVSGQRYTLEDLEKVFDRIVMQHQDLIRDIQQGDIVWNPRGSWAASTSYVKGDVVKYKPNDTTHRFYRCYRDHTSAASIDTDIDSGDTWVKLFGISEYQDPALYPPETLSAVTGTDLGEDYTVTISKPAGSSSAITVGDRIEITNNSTGITYASGAHDIGKLIHYIHNGSTAPLIILHENKFGGTGDVTTLIMNESQLAGKSGTVTNLIGRNTSINDSSGDITNLILSGVSFNNNACNISQIDGIRLNDWDEGTGTITKITGIHRPATQTSNSAECKIIENLDPDASLETAGKIIGSSSQELGSHHPGIATNRYYFPWGSGTPLASSAFPHNYIHGSVFVCPVLDTFNRIGIRVNNSIASSQIRFYIYEMANGVPTNLVVESSLVSSATAGDVEATISAKLGAGCYFVACGFTDDAVEILYVPVQTDLLGESDTDGVDNATVYGMAHTVTTAAPATFTPSATETSISPYIWVRKV